MPQTEKPNLLQNRNFRLLFIGETISNLDDQFTLIALPWLILKLTTDPLVLGAVMALAGVPRAVLMLVGGALSDRISPRKVMLISNFIRLINVAFLATMVLSGNISIGMIYAYALIFGTADAFFMPSQASMVASLSPKKELEQANTYIMGSAQLMQFIGPAAVGVLIGVLDRGNSNLTGIGLAMVLDAATFVVSLLTLMAIKTPQTAPGKKIDIFSSIHTGLKFAWSNVGLRYILFLSAAINFLLVGPIIIGIPVIAQTKLVEGAAGYGIIMSAYGIGTLIGFVLVGVLAKRFRVFARIDTLLVMTAAIGLLLALLAAANSIYAYAAISFTMALLSGYVSISFISLIQRRVAPDMMGRIMSIMTFSSVGLIPISEMAAGMMVKTGVSSMFLIAGLLFFAITMMTLVVPEVRKLGSQPIAAEAAPD